MSELSVETELASANPITEQEAAGVIPPGVGESMLREITATNRMSLARRILGAPFDGYSHVQGRAAFVAAVSLVALAVFSVNALSYRTNDPVQLADPAVDVTSADPAEVGPPATADQDGSAISVVTPDTGNPATTGAAAAQDTAGTDPNDDAQAPTTPDDQPQPVTPPAEPEATEPSTTAAPSTEAPATTVAEPDISIDPQSPGLEPVQYVGRCVVIEPEAMTLTGDWQAVNDPAASGNGYIVWQGMDEGEESDDIEDVISVPFIISEPGNYRFVWSMRQPLGVSGDVANDSWVNFPDAARFGASGGSSYDGFANVFGYSNGSFTWNGKADQGRIQSDISIDFTRAGEYRMDLAGRSAGHQIDSIVIHPEAISRSDASQGRCS